jgi:hypothetical protein
VFATRGLSDGTGDTAQAADLALLVELEARWENLQTTSERPPDAQPSTQDLHDRQRAYETFRARLAAYNRHHTPAHVPELLLNTPARLGSWCRAMRGLCLRVEHHFRGACPVHLVEKAYRWADRVADRGRKGRVPRPAPPGTIRAAIQELEALSQWCADQAPAVPAE